nr:hypothetical protein [uncultured Desulfobulbus sp.]
MKSLSLPPFSVFALLCIVCCVPSCSSTTRGHLSTGGSTAGMITDKNIDEASGIAASKINRGVLWVINDSGNTPALYAVDTQGNTLATVIVSGVKNYDWEDLATFVHKGKSYILIADTGDNKALRKQCFIHIVEEPDLRSVSPGSRRKVKPSYSYPFTYEDGPHDCEAVGVDAQRQTILLLTKREQPPVLYQLPLFPQEILAVARKAGPIPPLPRPSLNDGRLLNFTPYATQPTALDISEDGTYAVVLTYANAYIFTRADGASWLSAFATPPREIVLPPLPQAESACISHDGESLFVTSEDTPAPLLKVDLATHSNADISGATSLP